MKIYLDDTRPAPEGWELVLWPKEAIEHLKTGAVTHLSLDHDLGNDARGTGYDVILWLEEAVVRQDFRPPAIMRVHSANPVAKKRMEAGLTRIRQLANM